MKPEHSEAYENAVKAGLPIFEVLSDGAVKGYTGDDGKRRAKVVASSNAVDLVQDVMTPKALEVMQEAAKGTTIFMNHKYNVPEDVFGAVEKATLVRRTVQDNGTTKTLLCLDYDIIVEETNPRAVSTHDMMMAGRTKLGASVSVLILDKSEDKEGRRLIENVQYLEASIVGIPCNPTCWVMSASKAMKRNSLGGQAAEVPGEPVDIKELVPPAEIVEGPGKPVTMEKVRELIKDATEHADVIGADLPLAPYAQHWDAGRARLRMKTLAGSDKPNPKFKRGFFLHDSSHPGEWERYVFPFADVVDGELKAIPRALFVVAGAIENKALEIADEARERIKAKVSGYYEQIRTATKDASLVPPWEKKHYDFLSHFYAKVYAESDQLVITCPHCKSNNCSLTTVLKASGAGEESWVRCLACKGLFMDVMEERGLSFEYLISCFYDCLWELLEEKWDGVDESKIQKDLDIAIKEFAQAMRENAPKWLGIYKGDEAEKTITASLAMLKSLTSLVVSKAGARNNASDQSTIQGIHDAALELGAECVDNKSADSDQPSQATEATDKVASLTSELQTEQSKVAALEASNKAKDADIERWKAASLFAAAELNRIAHEPLPRAGQR